MIAEAVLRIEGLPPSPLEAAAYFLRFEVPEIRKDFRTMQGRLVLAIVFEPADYQHGAWRLAVVQQLAREVAPGRVNAIEGDDEAAIAAAVAYLASAPGITGQLLRLDGEGAGAVL